MKYWRTIFVAVLILCAATARAERLAVSVPVANIRSGPGTKYDTIWKVEKYHPIFVIEKKGPWYHFRDFEGDKGWIHKSLVASIPTVITKNEVNNVRAGPGRKYRVLFSVEKGIPFKVLNRKGRWIHIQHADGDKGWIYSSLVW